MQSLYNMARNITMEVMFSEYSPPDDKCWLDWLKQEVKDG